MSLPRICPSCQCIFYQDFVCTTCGAEKLRDETVRVQQKQIEALEAENARLREALEKLASVEGNGVARLALAAKDAVIERLREALAGQGGYQARQKALAIKEQS